MHKNRNESSWSELKGKAKRQWDSLNDKPFTQQNSNQNNSDDDVYGAQKTKRERADKHLEDVRDILQGMSTRSSKASKLFDH